MNQKTEVLCSKVIRSQLIRRHMVKMSAPNIYCRAHDVRKYCDGLKHLILSCHVRISELEVFWKSNEVTASRYLLKTLLSKIPCIALGSLF